MERVVLPAAAYRMSLTAGGAWENILVRTVSDLMTVYLAQGMDRGLAMDRIAERTQLDRQLVAVILKRRENRRDVETGKVRAPVTQTFCYLLYDLLAQQPYPELIPAEDFEAGCWLESAAPGTVDLLGEEDAVLRYQLSMGEKRQRAWILRPAGNAPLLAPREPPVTREMKRAWCRDQNSRLTYQGIVEPVGLICTCYLAAKDLSTVHVMNPLGKGTMDQLYARIRDTLRQEGDRNEELARRIQALEEARKEALEAAENYSSAHGARKQELARQYPGIEGFQGVWEKMAVMEARYGDYITARKNSQGEEADAAARDFVLGFYEALEELFALSLNRNYPRDKGQLLEAMVKLLDKRDNTPCYLDIAERAGFSRDEAHCARFFEGRNGGLKEKKLESILKNARHGTNFEKALPEMTAAHIFQAAAEPAHPFRRTARECPELLSLARADEKERRDVIKHGLDQRAIGAREGVEIPDRREIEVMRHAAETMLDILLVPRARREEQQRQAEDGENRRAARIRARESLEAYPALRDLTEVKKEAGKTAFAFFYQDPGYMSECSNLLSALYDVLLNEYSTQEQRQRASELFTGDREADHGAMQALFGKYGCGYESGNRPRTASIRQFIYNAKDLSVMCKLYLSFALLDREKPEFLKRLLEKAPGFPALTDRVCVERGHNTATVFSGSPDGYEGFHRELMGACDGFCQVLRDGGRRSAAENLEERETEKKGGA